MVGGLTQTTDIYLMNEDKGGRLESAELSIHENLGNRHFNVTWFALVGRKKTQRFKKMAF